MDLLDLLTPVANHYRRQADSLLSGEPDPYSFSADDVRRLIPDDSAEQSEFISVFAKELSNAEEERRSKITEKATILIGSAGISVTIALAIFGVLLRENGSLEAFDMVAATLLLLALGFFTWSAVVALTALRLEEIHLPDPLSLPDYLSGHNPALSVARDRLLGWSKDQSDTNRVAYLFGISLERFMLGLVFAFATVIALVISYIA